MIRFPPNLFRLVGCILILAAAILKLPASETVMDDETTFTATNAARLLHLVAGSDCVGVSVDLSGEILWVSAARNELVLRLDAGVLPVKLDLSGQATLLPGQHVRLTGTGTAGQGFLDQALVDNDGLHAVTEKSGTMYLTKGRHPIRAEWFNGLVDFAFSVEYAGPGVARQPIPNGALFQNLPPANGNATNQSVPGLSYRCYQGNWEFLPHWQPWLPVAAGTVSNFDLGVRTRDDQVGLEFTGDLQVDQPGIYTFWTKSDDGSLLFVGDSPLRVEFSGASSLPSPRVIQPGQALNPADDSFWAVTEGTITAIHADPAGGLALQISAASGTLSVEADAVGLVPPDLFSRIRVRGLCRATATAAGGYVAGRILISSAAQIETLSPPPVLAAPTAVTVADLRRLAASGQRTGCPLCLTGTVFTATSPQGFFAFQDDTGGVLVQLNDPGDQLVPGEQIILRGTGLLDGNELYMSHAPLVDNDGLHSRQEKTGATYLRAGKHPLHVSWFNRVGDSALEIYYQGPNLSRQKIPDSAFVRPVLNPDGRIARWVPGLDYESYEGDWQSLPKTSRLDPVVTGATSNLDLRVAPRADKVGLEFSGFLDVPADGQYFFSLASDDGSFLFLDEQVPQITRIGDGPLPAPISVVPRQILNPGRNNLWSEVEGTISFAYERNGALFLELSSEYGPMSVEIADASGGSPLLLLGGRARVQGFCQSGLVPGGQDIAAKLLTPGIKQVELLNMAPIQWNRYPLQSVSNVLTQRLAPGDETIVRVAGEIQAGQSANTLALRDASGTITLQTAQPLPARLTGPVEAIGRLSRSETNVALQCSVVRETGVRSSTDTNGLPLLTTVLQVKQLTREQAQRGYPVKIRGVVTLVRYNGTGFIIQDDTSAIDVWWSLYSNTSLPRVGDYWEVEGNTFVEFAPNISATHAERLGPGVMPEPLHPSWDQLLNGSLDTRYVELQGIVTAIQPDGVMLLTRAGKIEVSLTQMLPEALQRYTNALVRIRGCVVPIRNQLSQQVEVGHIRLTSVSLNVDEPAPPDPFTAELKHASDLLLFDARAGSLQRVRIAGQVLYTHDHEFYLNDQTNAIRVLSQCDIALQPGDLVDAVGFPELGAASPVLREAILRRTGNAPLPAPVRVAGDDLFNPSHDGRLITVEARLVSAGGDWQAKVLELQSGNREFAARLDNRFGNLMNLQPGSWLALTGIYSASDLAPTSEQQISSFELLLLSPDGVKVLRSPPWWTLQRALIFAGGLAAIILAGIFWILVLRRRIEEHAAQLALEVRRRELVQQQNVLEKERTRIAKDMHDQLGTNVTRVGLLGELARQNAGDPEKTAAHAEKICQTAFELGRTLDEIVWAVNPKNDSLAKFCDYIAVQAQELFQLTSLSCRVDLSPEMPDHPLSAEVRHNLFLASKEALNNVVRHANAREVWVRFKFTAATFEISILDNGQGFVLEPKHALRNGLQNMKKRLEDIGGRFTITSRPGQGTEVILTLDLNQVLKKNALDSKLRP